MQTKEFKLGSQTVKIDTGLIAKQANASVTVEIDGTVILGTLVASSEPNTNLQIPKTLLGPEKPKAQKLRKTSKNSKNPKNSKSPKPS